MNTGLSLSQTRHLILHSVCEKSVDETSPSVDSFIRLNEEVTLGGTDVNRAMDCSSMNSPEVLRTKRAFCFIRNRSCLCFPAWSLVLQRRQGVIPVNTQKISHYGNKNDFKVYAQST